MSNQPTKSKKIEGPLLLDRLKKIHPVELGMKFQGYWREYTLEGTIDKKILISSSGEFIASAKDIKEAIRLISEYEKREINDYNLSSLEPIYLVDDEIILNKIHEELMPKKITKSNGVKMHGKRFYIVKKKPDGTSSGKIFCLYNMDTRNLIWAHWDKDIILGFLQTKYKDIEHLDI